MRNLILYISLALALASCKKYLDVVPENTATLDDVFKRPSEALNFLYSLYAYMPPENDMFNAIALWGTDEMATPWDRSWYYAKRMMRGELNASAPFFDYWTSSGTISMYEGIRQCYIFINNIDKTPGFSDAEKTRMKGEARFLIGYFHFCLLRQYGPIVIMKGEVPLSGNSTDYYGRRSHYDTCVNYIAATLDEAAGLLPTRVSSASEYGRVTSIAAKAIRARMLLYAASPLFNGNAEYYGDFKDHEGNLLMPVTYDAEKWKRAADAAKDAIDAAAAVGITLYEHAGSSGDAFTQGQDNYRYAMVDPWNKELVWGYSQPEGYYGWQRHSAPRITGKAYNGQAPTIRMVETYYTKNGLPIDKDPTYDYAHRYTINGSTIRLHQDREPRFYASIGYDRGIYEINDEDETLQLRYAEPHGWKEGLNDYSPTGYLVKKGVHPQTIINASTDQVVKYPWPIVRLGELYLDYAEALNEYGGPASHTEVISYLDRIRSRSGVPGVLQAWSLLDKAAFTKEEMREIIRQERNIEMAFEGHRCWDVRRWKLGNSLFNVPVQGLNIKGATAEDFYKVTTIENRVFTTPGYYLFPIKISELEINKNLVQNPGW